MATERGERHRAGTTTILDLPPDSLLLILTELDHNELVNLSLVSKSFRSLTNCFVKNLNLGCVPSKKVFPKLLARFSSVTGITVYSKTTATVLNAVANSALKIERLKLYGGANFPTMDKFIRLSGKFGDVKALTLSFADYAAEREVVEFILLLFPSLEELYSCFYTCLGDFGIEKLVHRPLNLRKISLGLSFSPSLTDQALDMLSNCVNLEHFSLSYWGRTTIQGFCAFLRLKKKSLKSLELPDDDRFWSHKQYDFLQLPETISLCENLSHLKINPSLVKDDFLRVIASSSSRLTSLEFKGDGDSGYTMAGMSAMLLAFKGLTKLHVHTPWPVLDTADMEMSQLVKSLPCLKEIVLISQFAAYATLFSLIQNCPLLELIRVQFPNGCNDCELTPEIKKNYSVHRIILSPEPVDSLKIALKLACPSLKIFTFYQCRT